MTSSSPAMKGFYRRLGKRILDVGCIVILCPVILAVSAIICTAILLCSGFPLLFRQKRVGMYGEVFELLKFRTMAVGSEAYGTETRNDDPRVTAVGRILRCIGLDELPQVVNILRGEMSLVGPRPWTPAEIDANGLTESIRFSVRPGLVSFPSVIARHRLSFRDRDAIDQDYVNRLSLGLDVWILARALFQQLNVSKTTSGQVTGGFPD